MNYERKVDVMDSLAGSTQSYYDETDSRRKRTRLIIGASNGVYESFDGADSIERISTARINAFNGDPVVYGVAGNPGFLYFGAGTALHVAAGEGAKAALSAFEEQA